MIYSKLMRSLKENKFTISGEIDPPKGADRTTIIEQAEYLKDHVIASNVTDNPLGIVIMNTLVPCFIMQNEVGIEAVYQVTCRDRNRIAIQSDILGAAALGLKNVLALTGDHPRMGDHPESKAVFDLDSVQLTGLLRIMIDEGKDMAGNELKVAPKMHVGVGLSPGMRPLEPELIKFEKKIRAGAEFSQTQVIYDSNILGELRDETKDCGIPILVGIAPLKSLGMAKFMAKHVPGVVIPTDIMQRLEKSTNLKETTINITSELLRNIKEVGFPGAHIMPVGMDYAVGEIINRAGLK